MIDPHAEHRRNRHFIGKGKEKEITTTASKEENELPGKHNAKEAGGEIRHEKTSHPCHRYGIMYVMVIPPTTTSHRTQVVQIYIKRQGNKKEHDTSPPKEPITSNAHSAESTTLRQRHSRCIWATAHRRARSDRLSHSTPARRLLLLLQLWFAVDTAGRTGHGVGVSTQSMTGQVPIVGSKRLSIWMLVARMPFHLKHG